MLRESGITKLHHDFNHPALLAFEPLGSVYFRQRWTHFKQGVDMASVRNYARSPIWAVFPVAALMACSGNPLDRATSGMPPTSLPQFSKNMAPPSPDADSIIDFVMMRLEGPGFVVNDAGQGPSRFGIVGKFNGLAPHEVVSLTPERAKEIYKRNYWNAIDADDLPANMRLPAFNAAVQFGPDRAKSMIAQAQNDPQKLLKETEEKYNQIAINDPAKYAEYGKGWRIRQAIVSNLVSKQRDQAEARNDSLPPSSWPSSLLSSEVDHWPYMSPPQWGWPLADAGEPRRERLSSNLPIMSSYVSWVPPAAANELSDGSSPKKSNGFLFGLAGGLLSGVGGTLAAGKRRRWKPYAKRAGDKLRAAFTFDNDNEIPNNENEAFREIFEPQNPIALEKNKKWQINYSEIFYLIVQKNQVIIYGDNPNEIEDAMRYASRAWNNKCKLTGGTDEQRQKIAEAAQRLVDQGVIPDNFEIRGLDTFRCQNPSLRPDEEEVASLAILSGPR